MSRKLQEINNALIDKYDVKGSFYTDYPALGLWRTEYNEAIYINALKSLFSQNKDTPLLLYIHFPFCPKQCLYCQCYTKITNEYEKVEKLFHIMLKEIDLLFTYFDNNSITPNFKEIHLGGGSPTYLKAKEFDQLVEKLKTKIDMNNLGEFTIEIDPRAVNKDKLFYYHEKGVNRLSFGVQDFDYNVQKAINRIQPPELFEDLLAPDIRKHFDSVNFDMIFGLPQQTMSSFKKTIETLINLSPDRIAMCVLGYRPDIFKHQRKMKESEIPSVHERTMINIEAIKMLLQNDYVRIGLDHFAKPTDSLVKALKQKTMHRNSLGYTPGRCHDIIGIGPSSASRISQNYYFQNVYSLSEYSASVTSGKFPIYRGYKLETDDIIRRDIMHRLLTYFILDFKDIEKKYSIDSKKYFHDEMISLKSFEADEIIQVTDSSIVVTELGTLFARHVCGTFDQLAKNGIEYKHSRDYLHNKKSA